MGAELLCWILKGPRRLAKTKKKAAVRRAKEVIEFIETWDNLEGSEAKKALTTHLKKIDKVLRHKKGRDFYDFDCLVGASPEKVVETLWNMWPYWPYGPGGTGSEYRDMNWRDDPDDKRQIILVAGDMSWGDEPQGEAYQVIKYASFAGVLDVFGVR